MTPLTSQWSLDASRSPRMPRETPTRRRERAEEICRALVVATNPDGTTVLRRPLTPGERMKLTTYAAELSAAVAPYQRALARVTAMLEADRAAPDLRAQVAAVFSRTSQSGPGVPQARARPPEG
jgi:hypothetical protein